MEEHYNNPYPRNECFLAWECSCLGAACIKGCVECTALFIRRGEDVNKRCPFSEQLV